MDTWSCWRARCGRRGDDLMGDVRKAERVSYVLKRALHSTNDMYWRGYFCVRWV